MKYISLIIGFLFSYQANSQTITNYTTANSGLITDFVQCIDVDGNDNLWIGTPLGVQMFNGSNWTHYDITTSPGLPNNNIKVIRAMSNGDIWVGTDFGASIFDGLDWTQRLVNSVNSIDEVITQDSVYVCVGSMAGFSFSADGGQHWGYDSPNHWSGVNAVTYDLLEEEWWCSTPAGGVYNGDTILCGDVNEDRLVDQADVTDLITYLSGGSLSVFNLWAADVNCDSTIDNSDMTMLNSFIAGSGSLNCCDTSIFGSWDTVYPSSLISQNITSLLIDNQNNKWIGTDLGITVLDASHTSFTEHIDMYSLPPPHDSINPVVDIDIDSYGRIWTAIYVGYLSEGGVAYLEGSQWIDFDVADGLVGKNVKDLAVADNDNIWVATTTGVSMISSPASTHLELINKDQIKIYPNPANGEFNIMSGDMIRSISIYNNLSQLIYCDQIDHDQLNINLSHHKKGIYHIILDTDKGIIPANVFIE